MYTASKRHMDSAFQVSPGIKVIATLGEMTDILKLFSNHVCFTTQAMPQFQVTNFHYVSPLTPSLLKWPEVFLENLWTLAIVCTCNSSIHKNRGNNTHSFVVRVDSLLCSK